MDQLNLESWAGRVHRQSGGVSGGLASQIAATLESDDTISEDAPLPPLWHWCAFPPLEPMSALGRDGHPRGADVLPPMPGKRRMWAGGALRFHAPLRIGDPLERWTSLRDVTRKTGAAGEMIFATLAHAIYGPRGLAIEEQQDIVFLDMPTEYAPPKKRKLVGEVVDRVDMTEALLFRYSAVTFNAHRIHYDLAYASDVEKYPGLVVHGPLQATLMMQSAVRQYGRTPSDFSYRGVHPMFAGEKLEITTMVQDGGMKLCTGQNGHQGMVATAIWEDTL